MPVNKIQLHPLFLVVDFPLLVVVLGIINASGVHFLTLSSSYLPISFTKKMCTCAANDKDEVFSSRDVDGNASGSGSLVGTKEATSDFNLP